MGAIYKATCTKNGKVYVGQTIQPGWKKRYSGAQCRIRYNQRVGIPLRPFELAILKHGWESFHFEDIETDVPPEKLDEREEHYIRLYRSNQPKHGYNATSGGDAPKHVSESTKQKIRALHLKPATWRHKDLGEATCSAAELIARFPELRMNHSALSRLRRGHGKVAHGWVCVTPDNPPKRARNVEQVWRHFLGKVFVGSAAALAVNFGLPRDTRWSTTLISRPGEMVEGWSWVRVATLEEAQECWLRDPEQYGFPADFAKAA